MLIMASAHVFVDWRECTNQSALDNEHPTIAAIAFINPHPSFIKTDDL